MNLTYRDACCVERWSKYLKQISYEYHRIIDINEIDENISKFYSLNDNFYRTKKYLSKPKLWIVLIKCLLIKYLLINYLLINYLVIACIGSVRDEIFLRASLSDMISLLQFLWSLEWRNIVTVELVTTNDEPNKDITFRIKYPKY